MAVVKKTLFPENLERYNVFVEDTNPSSEYFKITELPDTFTGGKNAFLIAGSEYLVADTLLKIEIKDSQGNVIYHEPGEGIVSSSVGGTEIVTEYYEGISKVVAVHIYPDTSYGPATITILGELSSYNNNGLITPIPTQWEGQYNVKWQKQINVNPALANTTKIRFYRRPQATITETLSPIYTFSNGVKVESNIVSSFANIKISQMETFAGDVKRIKVFRTSLGDISDSDLIQDILVESKELLSTYELSGSVVGNGGLFTSETLEKLWISDGVTTELTSSRIDNGVKLNGAGKFKYSSSLNLSDVSVYELGLDAFYSASSESDLEIYISGSNNGEYLIGTLNGITPTKNLKDQIIQFSLPKAEPTASLYFSQSQSEWHLGNVSLKLTQDSAFSPSEIEFVTSMPTVIGNETYEFNFEFYDVNNNYVPVAVTQSALFTGGNNNLGGALVFISASQSSSLAELYAVSSSISGTMIEYSSSASASISESLSSSFNYTSESVTSLSGSVSSSFVITSGSITLVSSSLVITSQSLNNSLITFSASAASQSLYQVYSASAYLDKFIFTDENGKINQPPTASSPGLYLGDSYLGYYSGSGTSGWKTYMDNQGDFYLTSSVPGGGLLAWDSSTATLQINGSINVQGGNAATTTALSSSLNAVSGAINSATASLSASVAETTFTTNTGLIAKPPTVLVGSTSGLYLGNSYLGYYDGNGWKTFMANNGNFYLSGSGGDSLTWAGGVLSIKGAIDITGGNVQTSLTNINSTTASVNTSLSNINSTTASLNTSITNINSTTTALDARIFTNSSGLVNKTPSASTSGLYLGSTYLGYYNGSAWKTYMDNAGKFYLSGTSTNGLSWDGTTLSIRGTIKVDDGTEVTSATVTGAAAGATALQSGQTGKSLGLTGGSVGGVTIASNKIYVGTGTYGNANTGFYVDSSGNMSLKDKLTWDGTTLSITGNITVSGGNAATTTQVSTAQTTADNAATAASNAATAAANAQTTANGKISAGGAAADVNSNTTTISGGKIRTGIIESTGYSYSSGNYSDAGTQINLDNGLIRSKNFSITSAGDAYFRGDVYATSGTFAGNITSTATISGGTLSGAVIQGGDIQIGSDLNNPNFRVFSNGSMVAKIGYIGSTTSGWTISNNALESNSGVIKLYASDSAGGFNYGWIDMGAGTQFYLKGTYFWVDYSGPGGSWAYRECEMPQYVTTGGLNQYFAFQAKNQNAGEGAIMAHAWTSGNWGVYSNAKVGATSFPNTSDRRIKSDIKDLDEKFGVDFIKKLSPVEYKFNDDLNHKKFGFIAQDVTASLANYGMNLSNSALVDGNPDNPDAIMHINYNELIAPLVKSVQQLSKKIEQLEEYISGSINI